MEPWPHAPLPTQNPWIAIDLLSDLYTLTRGTLAGGDYLLWKSEFAEACKEHAKTNDQANNGQNADILLGEINYEAEDVQMKYARGLYAYIKAAATKAWKRLPAMGE